MNDRRVRIGRNLEEVDVEALVHERAGQQSGQKRRIETRVSIRGASSRDLERFRAMFSRVSSGTIYRRFHTPFSEVPERMLALMLHSDRYGMESFVAVAGEEIVGHAMYVRLGDGGDAEMAIIVEDRWQSKGVGKSLLRRLAEDARGRGIEAFVGTILPENRRMFGLIDAVFTGAGRTISDGVFHFRAPLRTLAPVDPARTLHRAA